MTVKSPGASAKWDCCLQVSPLGQRGALLRQLLLQREEEPQTSAGAGASPCRGCGAVIADTPPLFLDQLEEWKPFFQVCLLLFLQQK